MKRFLHDHSLSLVLALCFVLSLIAQAWFQMGVNGESFSDFLASVFENWQSEFLQLVFQVVLPVYLIHRGSPVSRDGDDEMKRTLDEIKGMLQTAAMRDYELAAAGETRGRDIQQALDLLTTHRPNSSEQRGTS